MLTLMLLGQLEEAKKSSEIMAAFVGFSKAYDKVDREKLWQCLERRGIGGRFLLFL